MKKRNAIIYWVATLWLSLGLVSAGIVQLLGIKEETEFILNLGYPEYLLKFLGATKLAGVIVLLLPRLPILKEWTYAGIFFTMAGALFSHLMVGDAPENLFGPSLLLVLTGVSWYFRPATRRLQALTA